MSKKSQVPKYWSQRRYTAWYDPQFEIRSADYHHAAPDQRLEAYIEKLRISIWQDGLKNPLLVTIKNGTKIIHPGKCRAHALLKLGRSQAPAIVVDFDRPRLSPRDLPSNVEFLKTHERVTELLSGDCVAEMSHRGLTIKKWRA